MQDRRRPTVFLVPRTDKVSTKQIKTSYSTAAGTAYITFDNVVVPEENMLGPEKRRSSRHSLQLQRMSLVDWLLMNEADLRARAMVMCCASARGSRMVVEESLKWATQRFVFGKPLIAQPVVRQK